MPVQQDSLNPRTGYSGYTRVLYSLYARGINPNRLLILPFVAVIPLLLFLFTTVDTVSVAIVAPTVMGPGTL